MDIDEQRAAAWLHDVPEDTELTPSDLRAQGIPPSVVAAVELLTRGALSDHLAEIRRDPIALAVKLAAIAANSDEAPLAQLDSPT